MREASASLSRIYFGNHKVRWLGREVYPALDAGSLSQPVPNLFRESQSEVDEAISLSRT